MAEESEDVALMKITAKKWLAGGDGFCVGKKDGKQWESPWEMNGKWMEYEWIIITYLEWRQYMVRICRNPFQTIVKNREKVISN